MGNMNAITYKEVFPFIKENKVWHGGSITGGGREFRVPKDYPAYLYSFREDESGNKFIRVKGVRGLQILTMQTGLNSYLCLQWKKTNV